MIRNGVERKSDHAILFVRSKGEVFEVIVSHEQLELLESIGGKVFFVTRKQPSLYVRRNKNIQLKTMFFGYDGIIHKNGNKHDFRPENIEKKQFKLEEVLKELEVN